MLKKKIPDTFAVFATVDTDEFGLLPIKRRRGEGGAGDLSTRIGDNFYNKFGRLVSLDFILGFGLRIHLEIKITYSDAWIFQEIIYIFF